MTGIYILIVFASLNFSDGGVALSTSEFYSAKTCAAAREKVLVNLKIETNYGTITAVCLKK